MAVDQWSELCLIGITIEGGSEAQFGGRTDEISFEMAPKDIESKAMANGNGLVRRIPYADNTDSVTFKCVPVSAMTDGTGVIQHFHPQSTVDNTDPINVEASLLRKRHKIVMLWAETLPAAASTIPASGQMAYRKQIVNAYCTSCVPNYDDKHLTYEMTFKWSPYQNGAGNMRVESTSSASLPAATVSVTGWA